MHTVHQILHYYVSEKRTEKLLTSCVRIVRCASKEFVSVNYSKKQDKDKQMKYVPNMYTVSQKNKTLNSCP